jgi:hypothetical protein
MDYATIKRLVRERLSEVIFHEADMGGVADTIVGDNPSDREKVARAIHEIALEVRFRGQRRA